MKFPERCARWAALCAGVVAFAAEALEYRSVGVNAAILYDAPSLQASKVFVVSRGYPVEVVVKIADWIKVIDPSGELAWIELKNLSDKRTVIVTAPVGEVRDGPSENATVLFKVEKGVVLDLLEPPASAWAKVRHRDGSTGYIRLGQIWGI